MLKLNKFGFGFFMLMFTVAFYIGRLLYNVVLTPVCWLLWQMAAFMPEDKADPNPSAGEKFVNSVAGGVAGFVDNHIFKRTELESEKWTREWVAKGCPAYKETN